MELTSGGPDALAKTAISDGDYRQERGTFQGKGVH